jgi:hypothetical protein
MSHSEGWVTMDSLGRAREHIAMLDSKQNLQGVEQGIQAELSAVMRSCP